jgi:PDZ-binding kinase
VSRSPWAVKKINKNQRESGPSLYTERLEREAKILRTLSHPNIIGFRAFKPAESGQLFYF